MSDVARTVGGGGGARGGQLSQPATPPMWHVTLTVVGDAVAAGEIRGALERLTHERPFLLSARYAPDRAELRYWEEARDLEDAAALALRLWGEHRLSAELPPWRVAGPRGGRPRHLPAAARRTARPRRWCPPGASARSDPRRRPPAPPRCGRMRPAPSSPTGVPPT